MVVVAQLVRALVCGTRGRGFESHLPPKADAEASAFFVSDRIGVAARHGVPDIWGEQLSKACFCKDAHCKCPKMPEAFGLRKQSSDDYKKGSLFTTGFEGPPRRAEWECTGRQGEHNPIRRQKECFSAPKVPSGKVRCKKQAFPAPNVASHKVQCQKECFSALKTTKNRQKFPQITYLSIKIHPYEKSIVSGCGINGRHHPVERQDYPPFNNIGQYGPATEGLRKTLGVGRTGRRGYNHPILGEKGILSAGRYRRQMGGQDKHSCTLYRAERGIFIGKNWGKIKGEKHSHWGGMVGQRTEQYGI